MAGKRLYNEPEFDSDNPTEKRVKSRPSFASVIGEVVMVNSLQNLCSALEPVIRKVVHEEVERGLRHRIQTFSRSSSFRIEAPETSSTLKLIFSRTLMQPIFTNSKIMDNEGNSLEILIVDTTNNANVPVDLGHPIKLDIVAIDGDFPSGENWSSEEFERKILKERNGKRPLLAGGVTVTMRNGVGTIEEIEFTDNSSWIRSRKFRIGAKVARSNAQSMRIREGMTEAFIVKDHRGELYKKHHPPALEDEVWRLEKIGKDGAFHRKLSSEGINTVQDFLKLSVVDSVKLRRILGTGMSDKMWEATLKHARECVIGNKLYIFRGPNFDLTLNPICQVKKAIINGNVFPIREMTNINRAYLENLVRQAYTNWASLEEVEGTTTEPALLTQGEHVGQHSCTNNYHHNNNYSISRSTQQHGVANSDRSIDSWETISSEYITTPIELDFRFSITGSSSESDLNPF